MSERGSMTHLSSTSLKQARASWPRAEGSAATTPWRPLRSTLLACGLLAVTACGGDDERKPAKAVQVGNEDGGRPMVDAQMADTFRPPPANAIEDLNGTVLCEYEDDDRFAFSGHPQATGATLAINDRLMALAFHDDRGERAVRLFGVSGAAKSAERAEASAGSDGVELVATEEGFAATWWVGDELFYERIRETGKLSAAATVIDALPEGQTTSMLFDGERVYLSLYADGELFSGDFPPDRGGDFTRNAVGMDAPWARLFALDGKVNLAWATANSVVAAELGSGDEPLVLAQQSSGPFDIAGGFEFAAVAYAYEVGDAQLVRYQSFRRRSPVAFNPRTVQLPPAVLRDVSITPFGNGYALAYRSLVSRDFSTNTIRIAFMTRTGHIVYEGEIATTSRAGGRTDIVATEDGHLALSWTDTDDNQVHLQRLYCPVALELCKVKE